MPVMILNRVVLPAPLGPMTPVISPLLMEKLTSSRAVTPPKIWVMPETSSMGAASLFQEFPEQVGHAPHQAARHEHDHHHQQATVDDDVVVVGRSQELGQQRQQGCPQKGAIDAPQPADDDHGEQFYREVEAKGGR